MIKILKIFFCCFALVSIVCVAMAKSYNRVDNYAKHAPEVSSESDLKRATYYLTSNFNSDEDKARAIYAWIVYNIDYDDYKYKIFLENEQKGRTKSVPEVDSILKTHAGICSDIAALYVKMAEYAKLDAKVVDGIASKGKGLTRNNMGEYKHSWVVVKINNKWKYVDPTWALDSEGVFADVRTDTAYRRVMKERVRRVSSLTHRDRNVSDLWFMTDEKEMIKTHFPNDAEWQLQTPRMTQNQFLRQFR